MGLPPIAAMSFTFTRTEQYPAQYGSAAISLPHIPSAANNISFPSPISIADASSPKLSIVFPATL